MAGTDPNLGGSEPTSVMVGDVDPLIGIDLGGYKVTKLLAAGGMGLVYEALHETIGRRAAVKVLKPEVAADAEWTKRFLSEARALGSLKHRNLIEVLNFGKTPDGREYLMMEFLEGEPLDAYIHRLGPLAPAVALGITDQILNGLAEAHKKGVVHRDLKPSNVYLLREHNGELLVKVLDFGLARQEPVALLDVALNLPKRQDGASLLAGTPEYIAPEQAQGKRVEATADLYALGVMMFEMLSGQLPFESPSVTELLQKHLSERPPKLSTVVNNLPEGVEDLVESLLQKEPEARPQSADMTRVQVQRLLKRLTQDATAVRMMPKGADASHAKTEPVPPKYAETAKISRSGGDAQREIQTATELTDIAGKKGRGPLVAGLVALVLLLGFGAWWAGQGPAPEPAKVEPVAEVVKPPPDPVPAPVPVEPKDEPGEVVKAPVEVTSPPAEVKPGPKPVVKPAVVVTKQACEVTDAWRSEMKANLNELGDLAAKDARLFDVFDTEGRKISAAVASAQSVNDCAAVTKSYEALKRRILK